MGNTTPRNQNWIQTSDNNCTQFVERFPFSYQVEANSPISGNMYTDNIERLVGGEYNDFQTRERGYALSHNHKTNEAAKDNHYPRKIPLGPTLTTAATMEAEQDNSQLRAQPQWSVDLKSTTRSASNDPNYAATNRSPLSFSNVLLEAVCASSTSIVADSLLNVGAATAATKSYRRRGHRRACIVFAGGVGNHMEIFTVPSPVL